MHMFCMPSFVDVTVSLTERSMTYSRCKVVRLYYTGIRRDFNFIFTES